jgi:signal transduction histidine kinase
VRAISSSLAEQDAGPGEDAGPVTAAGTGAAAPGVAAGRRPGWSRWIGSHRNGVVDTAWMVFSLANLDFIVMFPGWETIPFHFIWISLTLVYGFRTWKFGPTLWVLGAVMLLTAVGIGVAVRRGEEPTAELSEVPLMAAVFLAMVWHARRRRAAEHSYQLIAAQIARILADQRRFLQDAAHQLRTPITIALGHSELLAAALASDQQEGEDIAVVIGELTRLRRISDRLLLIAAAADPAFLHPAPVALDELVTDLVRRWRPAADRQWRTGTLDAVIVPADRERLALALDALIENAVRHTSSGDAIELAVTGGAPGGSARLVVTDTGTGIAADQLPFIFNRFNTGGSRWTQGTGLGLPLVAAVAAVHGGTVTVRSKPGEGSEFELLLPIADEVPRLPADSDCLPGPAYPAAGTVIRLRSAASRAGVTTPATRATIWCLAFRKNVCGSALTPYALAALMSGSSASG